MISRGEEGRRRPQQEAQGPQEAQGEEKAEAEQG